MPIKTKKSLRKTSPQKVEKVVKKLQKKKTLRCFAEVHVNGGYRAVSKQTFDDLITAYKYMESKLHTLLPRAFAHSLDLWQVQGFETGGEVMGGKVFISWDGTPHGKQFPVGHAYAIQMTRHDEHEIAKKDAILF